MGVGRNEIGAAKPPEEEALGPTRELARTALSQMVTGPEDI